DRALGGGLDALPRDFTWPFLLACTIEVAYQLDDFELVARVERELAPYSGQLIVVGPGTHVHGAADRYLGIASSLTGDAETANTRFAAAVALEEVAHSRPLQVRSRYWWARCLAERARTSSVARRRELATAVCEEAKELGMHGLADA